MNPSFIHDNFIHLDGLFPAYRNHPALTTPDGTKSFEDVYKIIQDVVIHLKTIGVFKGARVAIHGPNSELHLYLFLASWIMDFLYIPFDFKAPLASLLSNTPIDFLITDDQLKSDMTFPIIHSQTILRNQNTGETFEKHNQSDPSVIPASTLKGARTGTRLHQDLSGFRDESGTTESMAIPFEQEASAIFTSGSTGKPRGIVHAVGNYIYSALGTDEFIGLDSSDRWLLSLPLFHVGGALIWVRTLLAGAACILPGSLQPLEDSIRQYVPTVISLVPAQLIRLLENAELVSFLKNMKCIMLGGAPSPDWLIDRSLDLGLPVMPTYGCTESCAQVTGVARGSATASYYTAGRIVPYRDVRIAEDGIIFLGGQTLFKRYLHEPVSSSCSSSGFFKTADSGRFDDEGNLVISGRTDGVFISGGENIAPQEIEKALLKLDGIITAMVVPVPHREFGLTPWAFVETSAPVDEKNIRDQLRKDLPGYKLPKRILRLTPDDRQGKMKFSREELTRLARRLTESKPQTQLHYEETEQPDALVIVFLHGFMGKAQSWKIIMDLLPFRCIAFDLPGHGSSLFSTSCRLNQLNTMEETARLILEDLDTLGIQRFALYGYSMGGRIAQHIALAAPDRISHLILESASFGISDPKERAERLKKDQVLLTDIKTPEDFRVFLENWYKMPLFRTISGTRHLQTLIENKINHPVAEFQRSLNLLSVGGHDFLAEKLAACRFPIHYFCGEQDVAYRQTAQQMRLHLPEMTVKIFKNASHNICIQYSHEIARSIREILI